MPINAVLENLDGVSDALKSEYTKGANGKFYLSITGIDDHPDVGALKRAKDHEKAERQKAAQKAKEQIDALQSKFDALESDRNEMLKGAIPKADVDKLETSYKEKLANIEAEKNAKIDALNGSIQTMMVGNVAQTMASEISTSPALILPHIASRLKVEFGEDGSPATRVLDKTGAPSALTVDDLKKEFAADPTFAPIIIGSKASGAGAGGQGQGGAQGKKFGEMNEAERTEFYKRDPEGFKRSMEEFRRGSAKF